MTTRPRDERPDSLVGDASAYRVDARGAGGVLVGEQATQFNYFIYNGTFTDGVAAPPLIGAQGTITSPYRGLSAFEERDAGLFFGREVEATEVLRLMSRQLHGSGLLVVSGVSGAGKSSLMRAGVLPRLRGAGLGTVPEAASWPCVVFNPTSEPLDELSMRIAPLTGADVGALRNGLRQDPAGFTLTARVAAMGWRREPAVVEATLDSDGQRRLLIVVDQCEQLFTRCDDEKVRQAFITALHAAATGGEGGAVPAAVVVLVVRADFEARLADYSQLASAVQDRYLLTSMTERQLRMAITRPAAAARSGVDADLVQVLLEEARHQVAGPTAAGSGGLPGAGVMPLLSHALDQAWRRRTGQTLTLADYERVGGIEGAVARSAEHAYCQLTPAQQTVARQVFTLLAATNSDGADTASRVHRPALTAGKSENHVRDVETVLETFAAERLLILAAGTVELCHEVLLTAWPLYRDTWLAETQVDRMIRGRLRAAADEWDNSSHDPAYLYRGSLLEAASEAATRIDADARHAALGPAEKDFLKASQSASRRRVRRGRIFSAILTTLVIGLASIAVAVVRAGHATASQRDIAISELLASESLALGDTNATVSQLKSIAAWGIDHSPQAGYAMLTAAARPQVATITVGASPVKSVAFSPDGKIVATASSDGTVQLWNRATLQRIGTQLSGSPESTSAVAVFSPDGTMLATGDSDGTVRLWDTATRNQIGVPLTSAGTPSPGNGVTSVAFSPRGKMIAITLDGATQLWDVTTHKLIRSLAPPGIHNPDGNPTSLETAVFSPDGKSLATGGDDGAVRMWDVDTGQQIGGPLDHDPAGVVMSVAFSPDGTTLAAAGVNHATIGLAPNTGMIRLWDVATGRQIGNPLADGTIGTVQSVVFSPDGSTLASGSLDGAVRLWKVASRTVSVLNSAVSGLVTSVAFSPDGSTLASASSDGTARLWNVTGGRQTGRPLDSASVAAESVAFSPDGKILATGGENANDGVVKLWSIAAHRQIGRPIKCGGDVTSVAFGPDGKLLAAACDGKTELWNVATHDRVESIAGGIGPVAFSPDGRLLAVDRINGEASLEQVGLWDIIGHRWVGRPLFADKTPILVESLAFSPDGRILAVGEGLGADMVRLWDVATHRQIGKPLSNLSTGRVDTVAFSPDGTMLATGSEDDGAVQLWDVATRQNVGGNLTSGITSTSPIDSVAFSPDGSTLASGSGNGAVLVWDVATHQQIGSPLISGPLAVWSVAFSRDGATLAVGSGGGLTRLWDVSYLHSVLALLCLRVGGSVTRPEWERYVPPGPSYRNVCR